MDDIDQELAKLPTAERETLLKIGKAFGSTAALAQARLTLNALAAFGANLSGFTTRQKTLLEWTATALERAGAGRADSQAAKKSTNLELVLAMREAKAHRLEARSVLEAGVMDLRSDGSPDAQAAVRAATIVLDTSASSGANPDALAQQLDQLADQLSAPAIAAIVAEDGGPDAVTHTRASAATLRTLAATTAVPRGTPAETQRLDLLDGLAVELVRQARRAARAAGRRLGNPALSDAFELNALYPYRASPITAPTPPAPPAPPTPAPAPTPGEG